MALGRLGIANVVYKVQWENVNNFTPLPSYFDYSTLKKFKADYLLLEYLKNKIVFPN